MSDREIIIKSLEKAERRLRTNRLFGDLTFSLSLFLLFPLVFKIWDLLSPFRGTTVAVVLGTWVTCLAFYSLWRTLQKGTLEQAAAQVDTKAGLADELKTAYWFITHPRTSDWIDVQIRRASKRASGLNIDRLYPRVIPATSYLAAALLALLIGLNFLPLPWNHNWVYLQAAPAFSLTDAERNFLAQAQQLLAKIDLLDKGDLAARIEEIMKELQEGKIDVAEASKELEEIQKRLGTKVLDTAAIDNKLNEIAEDFKAAEQQLKEAAEALQERNLEDTASRMKKAAEDLEATAESLKDQDKQAANRAMKDAEFLKDLSEKIQDRQFKDQAVRELQNLTESLQQRDANSQTAKSAAKERGEGEGEIQPVEGEPGKDDTGSAPTDSPSEGGSAQNPSGRHGNDAPVEGPPTQKLDVQLQQEQLTGQHDQEVKPEEIEQTSKQERSKLDYRNVPSELSAAQKDVLNQESIPWQYRRLIKNYFAAIQPRHKDNK
jgi:hypothetical protein